MTVPIWARQAAVSRICYSRMSMALFKKTTPHRIFVFLLALASLAATAILDAQQSTAPAKSDPPSSTTNAEFAAAADEVLQQMSEITGLKLRAPLK